MPEWSERHNSPIENEDLHGEDGDAFRLHALRNPEGDNRAGVLLACPVPGPSAIPDGERSSSKGVPTNEPNVKCEPSQRMEHGGGGQPTSFEALSSPLLPSLYNAAYWLTRNTVEAEDLLQETLFKALRGLAGFEMGTNFKAWIFRILRNTYLTSQSGLAAKRTVALELTWEESVDYRTPEEYLIKMADWDALQRAMEQLPPPLLEVIILCDFEEMKYKEITMILDIPIGTVMSRIARARANVRRALMALDSPITELRK